MSDSKTIHSAVIINGGEEVGLNNKSNSLYSRELYFSEGDGYLYVGRGNNKSASKVNSYLSDISSEARSLTTSLISVNHTSATAKLGAFTLKSADAEEDKYLSGKSGIRPNEAVSDTSVGTFYIRYDGTINRCTIKNSLVSNTQLDKVYVTGARKLVLSNEGTSRCYGTVNQMKAVESPQEGQLFFVIPS